MLGTAMGKVDRRTYSRRQAALQACRISINVKAIGTHIDSDVISRSLDVINVPELPSRCISSC